MSQLPSHLDFLIRGGEHPDAEMNEVEKMILMDSFNKVLTSPSWFELGFKRSYNFLHCLTFYMTRDPALQRLLFRLAPFPQYVEMEAAQGYCKLNCIFCEKTYWNEENQFLSYSDFKKAMEQFPDLKWAGINALGDPFLNKDYWKMLQYLDNRDVVQELYTSAFQMEQEDMEKFVDLKGMVFLKFSFDAATKKTYEKLRVGSDYEKVLNNIIAFDEYRKRRHRAYPKLMFHYIIMKDNIHEAPAFLDLIDKMGIRCDGVTYSRLLHNFKEINHLFMEIPPEFCSLLYEKGRRLNIPVTFNADIPGSKIPANECTAWLMPYIFPDGSIICCCCMNEQNRRDWQRATSMGNIFKQSMREIWYGKAYTQLRNKLKENRIREAHPVCERCNIYDISKDLCLKDQLK